ncbi:Glycerol uptake facilitator protein [Rubripirellula lacrimiformis]|uniref:Glycerol uptake facilitator protein n=2 Tax=Rubripirellula lacrimiformis TaxID=1930273 RepID=A0A517N4L8_9BACT|nr:Glycerol uptake facilitator protein [Rubripirellula lacrimiformis]
MLVLFGNGVVANMVLARTKAGDGSWLLISAGWGVAVFVGAFCANEVSGAHLNPAVSIAMFVAGKMELELMVLYIAAQFVGAIIGAALVYAFYRPHFDATDDADAKLACFSTGPAIPGNMQAFFCEAIGTFALILPIFLMAAPSLVHGSGPADTDPILGLGSLGLLPVGLLVFGIGMSLGGTTGYAINPARDLGPRLVHFLFPIKGKRDSDWGYAWVPVAGPIVGAVLAAVVYRLMA